MCGNGLRLALALALALSLVRAAVRWIDHGYEYEGARLEDRSGKALRIGELLASACSTSALLDRS